MLTRFTLWGIFIIYCTSSYPIQAQNSYINSVIKEGKPCPNFLLHGLQDDRNKIISLKSLKGKPFILDFFSTGCTSCFASFAKINQLNKEYAGQVKIILIGQDDKYIRKAYNTFKKMQNLDIPHVFDTITVNKFKIVSFPYVIWVDANGIITAVTLSAEITAFNLSTFALGKSFDHINRDEGLEKYVSFDIHKPVNFDESVWGDNLFFQRSLITAWRKDMGNAAQLRIEDYSRIGIPVQIVGWPLSSLYKLAYTNRLADWLPNDSAFYGKFRYSPIYEMSDSSLFQFDWKLEKNKFCYSQILARNKRDTAEMLRIMREDLYNAFGYTATIETREMPYLKLIKNGTEGNLLKSQGNVKIEETFIDGVNLKNVPVSSLLSIISYKAGLVAKDLPLIDETGIDYPIDIQLSASMTDINDIIKELPAHGLAIVYGVKNMKVLVIRDNSYSGR